MKASNFKMSNNSGVLIASTPCNKVIYRNRMFTVESLLSLCNASVSVTRIESDNCSELIEIIDNDNIRGEIIYLITAIKSIMAFSEFVPLPQSHQTE